MYHPRRNMTWGAAATTIALLALPAIGHAAEDASLAPGGPAFEWSGGPGNGLPVSWAVDAAVAGDPAECNAWHECDHRLLRLDAPGDLHVRISGRPGQVEIPDADLDLDLDLYVYASDAAGAKGDQLSETGATANATEEVDIEEAPAGYYLVRVVYYQGMGATYTGAAELTPSGPDGGA